MIINIGGNIREQREKLGLKVYELAKKVKVNPVYITQIEKSVRIPSPAVFFKIITTLKFPADKAFQLRKWYIAEKFSEIRTLDDWMQAYYEDDTQKSQAKEKRK